MSQHKAVSNKYVLLVGNGAEPEVFEPLICMTSVQFNTSVQVIESNTKCGNSKQPGVTSFTVPIEGSIVFDPDSGSVGMKKLHDLIAAKDPDQNYKVGPEDPDTGDLIYAFKGFPSSVNATFPTDADSTFSGQIEVSDSNSVTITETA